MFHFNMMDVVWLSYWLVTQIQRILTEIWLEDHFSSLPWMELKSDIYYSYDNLVPCGIYAGITSFFRFVLSGYGVP